MIELVSSTVLVVDDDQTLSEALSEWLTDEGYEVVTTPNGLSALARLRQGLRPGVIILDLMMPVMDGWDFRAEQLRDPELSSIPVVLFSAAGFSEESIRSQFGAIDFVGKPPSAKLLQTIERLCRAA